MVSGQFLTLAPYLAGNVPRSLSMLQDLERYCAALLSGRACHRPGAGVRTANISCICHKAVLRNAARRASCMSSPSSLSYPHDTSPSVLRQQVSQYSPFCI